MLNLKRKCVPFFFSIIYPFKQWRCINGFRDSRGRVALVGASGRGLGRATAEHLAKEGVRVAICDKDESILDEARTAVATAANGGEGFAYSVDLTKVDEIERLVADVKRDLGPISILVTNSGGPPPGTFSDATDEKWEFAYQLTFLSAVRLIRAALPDMKAQEWGRIINFYLAGDKGTHS